MIREFYAIRHKTSGGLLPELYGLRAGYTHTEPDTYSVPRLFITESGAKRALTWWLKGVTSVSRGTDYEGHYDETWGTHEMPERKAEGMEVVIVLLKT